MKQHITTDQLAELTEKQREKLNDWYWGRTKIIAFRYYKNNGKTLQKAVLPKDVNVNPEFLTIGSMIEFLDEHVTNFELRGGRMGKSYLIDVPDNSLVWHGWSGDLEIEDEPVLCDALWEAVKWALTAS
jgi:hypothetical protein